jgi:hypothetical protein
MPENNNKKYVRANDHRDFFTRMRIKVRAQLRRQKGANAQKANLSLRPGMSLWVISSS